MGTGKAGYFYGGMRRKGLRLCVSTCESPHKSLILQGSSLDVCFSARGGRVGNFSSSNLYASLFNLPKFIIASGGCYLLCLPECSVLRSEVVGEVGTKEIWLRHHSELASACYCCSCCCCSSFTWADPSTGSFPLLSTRSARNPSRMGFRTL